METILGVKIVEKGFKVIVSVNTYEIKDELKESRAMCIPNFKTQYYKRKYSKVI